MPQLTEEEKLEIEIAIDKLQEQVDASEFQHCYKNNASTQKIINTSEKQLKVYADILNQIYNSDNYKQLQQNIQITYVLVCIVVMIILYITIIYVKQRWYTV
jgi:hypothetical protein